MIGLNKTTKKQYDSKNSFILKLITPKLLEKHISIKTIYTLKLFIKSEENVLYKAFLFSVSEFNSWDYLRHLIHIKKGQAYFH